MFSNGSTDTTQQITLVVVKSIKLEKEISFRLNTTAW
jgi:hypothetical protein